ncbi:Max-like protein homolog 2 [Caenorhabditis elegans]|uniref:Max-like protein homolog 2 n=1 Tax=Caenorhabditis elegans TaxID=6239 RepID=MXL2_CAEEL|nr:Max-like protein homolog 2 [Caenorhabditis elegans]Q9TZ70.1 RecName: Full=Max-like protein homolog 2 [Caenorhabditis elegans]CCD70935.1 Max-like protein homolog 2 [Caenorhabditis elegans]|eukprot:NP_497173.1 MaX-Like [Caenorhabditis elegans]
MSRSRSAAASSSQKPDDMDLMSPDGSASSPSAPNTPATNSGGFSSDRKKATHLRCERQRREAINSGYSDLKDLIPQTTTSLGCKTTNAAILFRACDFMSQLKTDISDADKQLAQLNAQAAALEMIASEYEQMASSVPDAGQSTIQVKMLQLLLDDCFTSFSSQVDFTTYATITRTLLSWVESLAPNAEPFKSTAGKMVTMPFTSP